MQDRYRVPGPEIWHKRSARYLEDHYSADRTAALALFGLLQPIAASELAELLKGEAARLNSTPQTQADYVRAGRNPAIGRLRWSGKVTQGVVFPKGDNPLSSLAEIADRVSRELRVEPWRAVRFLLTGSLHHGLPWLEVTMEPAPGPMGDAFTIYVGSQDVTAEDVRAAFAAAVRDSLDAGESDRAPRSDEIELWLHETCQREARRSWEDAWIAWGPKAAELGVSAYEDKTAYRNKVESLRRRFPWMREDLDAAGMRNSKEYLRHMRGGDNQ